MKKLLAVVLAAVMVLSLAVIAHADDPIVVTMWHTRGSGANGDRIQQSVDDFNATIGAEKGIRVEHLYQGNYVATKSAILKSTCAFGVIAMYGPSSILAKLTL